MREGDAGSSTFSGEKVLKLLNGDAGGVGVWAVSEGEYRLKYLVMLCERGVRGFLEVREGRWLRESDRCLGIRVPVLEMALYVWGGGL